jgi:hypothetical protein
VKIIQIMPAPQGLTLLYRGDEEPGWYTEPAAALGLQAYGSSSKVVAVECHEDGFGEVADNLNFMGAFWSMTPQGSRDLEAAVKLLEEDYQEAKKHSKPTK